MDTFCYSTDYIFHPLGKKWDDLSREELLAKEAYYRPTVHNHSYYDDKESYRDINWTFPKKISIPKCSPNQDKLKSFLISKGIILNTRRRANQYYQYTINIESRRIYKYLCIFKRITELGIADKRINLSSHDKELKDNYTIQHHLSLERLRLNLADDTPLTLKPFDVYMLLLPSIVHNLQDEEAISKRELYNRFVKPESIQGGTYSAVRKSINKLSSLALKLSCMPFLLTYKLSVLSLSLIPKLCCWSLFYLDFFISLISSVSMLQIMQTFIDKPDAFSRYKEDPDGLSVVLLILTTYAAVTSLIFMYKYDLKFFDQESWGNKFDILNPNPRIPLYLKKWTLYTCCPALLMSILVSKFYFSNA